MWVLRKREKKGSAMANEKKDTLLLKGRKWDIGFEGGHACVCGKTIQGLPEL